jgi:hypothetical protein
MHTTNHSSTHLAAVLHGADDGVVRDDVGPQVVGLHLVQQIERVLPLVVVVVVVGDGGCEG